MEQMFTFGLCVTISHIYFICSLYTYPSPFFRLLPTPRDIFPLTAVGALDALAVGLAVGEGLAVDLDVCDAAAVGADAALAGGGGRVVEVPLAKVGKGLRVAAVLEDPLGVGLTEGLAHVAVGGGDVAAGGEVLEGRGARVGRGGVDRHADHVAVADGELVVVVHGRLGPPLVPGADGAVAVGLDAGLEDGTLAAVA